MNIFDEGSSSEEESSSRGNNTSSSRGNNLLRGDRLAGSDTTPSGPQQGNTGTDVSPNTLRPSLPEVAPTQRPSLAGMTTAQKRALLHQRLIDLKAAKITEQQAAQQEAANASKRARSTSEADEGLPQARDTVPPVRDSPRLAEILFHEQSPDPRLKPLNKHPNKVRRKKT